MSELSQLETELDDARGAQTEYLCRACLSMADVLDGLAREAENMATMVQPGIPGQAAASTAINHASGAVESAGKEIRALVRECTVCGKWFIGKAPVQMCGQPPVVELCPKCAAAQKGDQAE